MITKKCDRKIETDNRNKREIGEKKKRKKRRRKRWERYYKGINIENLE